MHLFINLRSVVPVQNMIEKFAFAQHKPIDNIMHNKIMTSHLWEKMHPTQIFNPDTDVSG